MVFEYRGKDIDRAYRQQDSEPNDYEFGIGADDEDRRREEDDTTMMLSLAAIIALI